jgi:hypothetical protein
VCWSNSTSTKGNSRVEDAGEARVDCICGRARVVAVVDLVVEGFDLVRPRHLVHDALVGDDAAS